MKERATISEGAIKDGDRKRWQVSMQREEDDRTSLDIMFWRSNEE